MLPLAFALLLLTACSDASTPDEAPDGAFQSALPSETQAGAIHAGLEAPEGWRAQAEVWQPDAGDSFALTKPQLWVFRAVPVGTTCTRQGLGFVCDGQRIDCPTGLALAAPDAIYDADLGWADCDGSVVAKPGLSALAVPSRADVYSTTGYPAALVCGYDYSDAYHLAR